MRSFQDQIPNNHCFGCGPHNSSGLRIKSFWQEEGVSICEFRPEPHHCSGPKEYLNGGIIATAVDCHCICTAIAQGYKDEGREIGSGEPVWYVTGGMEIKYHAPSLISSPFKITAEILETDDRKMKLDFEAYSGTALAASGSVMAIKVGSDW